MDSQKDFINDDLEFSKSKRKDLIAERDELIEKQHEYQDAIDNTPAMHVGIMRVNKKELSVCNNRLQEVQEGIDFINNKIINLELSSNKRTLEVAIWKLNFTTPRKDYRGYNKNNNSLNIILIRGTKNCGHNILARRLYKISKTRTQPKTINFQYLSPSKDDIWAKVHSEFEFNGIASKNNVINKFVDRLQAEDIILNFDNIDHFPFTYSLEIIGSFWHDLVTLSNGKLLESKRFFLFLFDRQKDRDEEFSSDIFYQFSKQDKNTLLNLEIEPLTKSIVEGWFHDSFDDIPDEFNNIIDEIDEYFNSEKEYFLDVVGNICEKCAINDLFDQIDEPL